MVHRIAVLAFDGISPFHLAVPTTVFGTEFGAGLDYRVQVCGDGDRDYGTTAGYRISVARGLRTLAAADTIVLPSWDPDRPVPQRLAGTIARAHDRGARVIGLCVGAFLVAGAGIADGRDVTTHWNVADRLARCYPQVRVRSDVLWTDHGDVITSAGTVASLDCCLHVVRSDHGAAVAAELARRLVMPPHRGGSQAQYIPSPVADPDEPDPMAEAMVWARNRLDRPITLDEWAAAVAMSKRNFTRRFTERTGGSPGRWLHRQRLDRARELLETTTWPIEQVAIRSGFGSTATLRRNFVRELRVSPRRHREQFASAQ